MTIARVGGYTLLINKLNLSQQFINSLIEVPLNEVPSCRIET